MRQQEQETQGRAPEPLDARRRGVWQRHKLASCWTLAVSGALAAGGVLQVLGPPAAAVAHTSDPRGPIVEHADLGPRSDFDAPRPAGATVNPVKSTPSARVDALLAGAEARIAASKTGAPANGQAAKELMRVATALPNASPEQCEHARELATVLFDRARTALAAGKVAEEQHWLALGSILAPPPDLRPSAAQLPANQSRPAAPSASRGAGAEQPQTGETAPAALPLPPNPPAEMAQADLPGSEPAAVGDGAQATGARPPAPADPGAPSKSDGPPLSDRAGAAAAPPAPAEAAAAPKPVQTAAATSLSVHFAAEFDHGEGDRQNLGGAARVRVRSRRDRWRNRGARTRGHSVGRRWRARHRSPSGRHARRNGLSLAHRKIDHAGCQFVAKRRGLDSRRATAAAFARDGDALCGAATAVRGLDGRTLHGPSAMAPVWPAATLAPTLVGLGGSALVL